MIHPEGRLEELFATLPPLLYEGRNYPPVYNFGTRTQLYAFLNDKRKEVNSTGEGNIYPIIWLETPIRTSGSASRITFPLELVMAVLTTKDVSNKERLEVSFEQQLVPLYGNIVTALKKSGFTEIMRPQNRKSEESFDIAKYFNYGTDSEDAHQTNDIWDAMKIWGELAMTDKCQREFNY